MVFFLTSTIRNQMSELIDSFSISLDDFVQRCKDTNQHFNYTTKDLFQMLDKDPEMKNRGDYFELWIKTQASFGGKVMNLAMWEKPMKWCALKDYASKLGLCQKAGGNSKADAIFANESVSIKFLGGAMASLAAYTRRSLLMRNVFLAPLEKQLSKLFKELFAQYPGKDRYQCNWIQDEESKKAIRKVAIYYCSKGTASGLQANPAQRMLVVTDPLNASSWFVGTPEEFVDTYWDSLSWEFRSRRTTSKELDVSKIRELIADMEWHDPARTSGKAHFMFGLRVKKRSCDSFDEGGAVEEIPKRVKLMDTSEMHALKDSKDCELQELTSQSSTTLMDHLERPYGSVFHKWHLRNQSYEIVVNQRKLTISNDQTDPRDVMEELRHIQQHASILLYAQKAFRLKARGIRNDVDRTELEDCRQKMMEFFDTEIS